MTRIEWGVLVALLGTLISSAFSVGVVYSEVQRHEVRIQKVEDKTDAMREKLARVDAGVAFLVDQAREQRRDSAK